ncbi:hypothetical protein ACF0H5_000714 [Mactra antiquata]
MATRETDVIIVGAGISGLTAARYLLKKDPNLQVLVLEAKDRVGGRTLSVNMKCKNGTDTWDLGGQWVGRCQPHIMSLLDELGIETHTQYQTGRKYLQIGPKYTITSYTSDIPTLSLVGLLDLNRLINLTDKLAGEIDPEDPFSCPKAELWDSMTLESFIDSKIWSKDVKDVFRACFRTMLGVEISQVSLLYFLTYVASCGDLKTMVEASEHSAQEYRIKGGSQQVCIKLLEEIGSSRVLFNEPVTCIEQQSDHVIVYSRNGCNYKCQKIILAIPPMQKGRIQFNPILPTHTREIIKRMPPSNILKFVVTFPQDFWREAGSSGEVVSNGGYSDIRGCDVGPLCVVYDGNSSNGEPALVGLTGGLQCVQWQHQSPEDRKSAVIKSLADIFGEKVHTYIEYRDKVWDVEPYNEGAPVSCVSPGAMRYYANGLREPFNRIHFAGTESATVWCGFMNGAVQAGQRAAIEVLYDIRPQLISAHDLSSIKYPRQLLKQKSSRGKKLLKITIGIGVITLIALAVNKMVRSK